MQPATQDEAGCKPGVDGAGQLSQCIRIHDGRFCVEWCVDVHQVSTM
ncbi:hypothetical protein OK016_25000 [Vibrio chagasii]|nr:hypothetical protein [Vibrio chagasii]